MDGKEGFLLIGTTMIILIVFLIAVFMLMLIYRKRKIEHTNEVQRMNERFSHELLKTQLEVQRETIQQIGREIHDNVGQKLTLAALYMQQLENKQGYADNNKFDSVASIINESLSELRGLSKTLIETNHQHLDLIEVINKECDRVQNASKCTVLFITDTSQLEVSQAAKNFVLRILQEFIHNSLKHSGCSQLQIMLNMEEFGIKISAKDNGKGFNNQETYSGIGLKNMKKRAELIGADFNLESTPGAGTAMQLFIKDEKLDL